MFVANENFQAAKLVLEVGEALQRHPFHALLDPCLHQPPACPCCVAPNTTLANPGLELAPARQREQPSALGLCLRPESSLAGGDGVLEPPGDLVRRVRRQSAPQLLASCTRPAARQVAAPGALDDLCGSVTPLAFSELLLLLSKHAKDPEHLLVELFEHCVLRVHRRHREVCRVGRRGLFDAALDGKCELRSLELLTAALPVDLKARCTELRATQVAVELADPLAGLAVLVHDLQFVRQVE
mmetsp:Transcript_15759/g.32893  ORF Transcript_15759/g.32893 Transcript_15759/m.32893 type:complete len:241 (-) Transcript_15759:171-893(-)